jgi:hypothetical protein
LNHLVFLTLLSSPLHTAHSGPSKASSPTTLAMRSVASCFR